MLQALIDKRMLDFQSGKLRYRSIHFPVQINEIANRIVDGDKCVIDIEKNKMRFKRVQDTQTEQINIEERDQHKLNNLIPQVIRILQSNGRDNDFIKTLQAIVDNKLTTKNIALSLLLDVGKLLNEVSSKQMRYSKTSIEFWMVVKKLFRGKATRFFSGE